MIDYRGLVMIAVVYNGLHAEGNEVGMRIYDIESGNVMDTSIRSVESNLKSGRTICNLRIDDLGNIGAVGNDRLSFYTGLDLSTRKIISKRRYVMTFRDNCIFCIDWNGTCKKLGMQDLVSMINGGNIANFQYARAFVNSTLNLKNNKWYQPVAEAPKNKITERGGYVKVDTEIFQGARKLRLTAKLSDGYRGYDRVNCRPSNNFIILFTGADWQLVLYDVLDNPNNVVFSYLLSIYKARFTDEAIFSHCQLIIPPKKEPREEIKNTISAEDIIYIDKKLCVTSSEIANTPGILSKKMETVDRTWERKYGSITGDTVGVMLVANKFGIPARNEFTLVIWYQGYRQIGVIDIKVDESLLNSIRTYIFPLKLDSYSEKAIGELDTKLKNQFRNEPMKYRFGDLMGMDNSGVISMRINKSLADREMVKSIELPPILAISDRAIKNSRRLGNGWIYVCSLKESVYNVYTELPPDKIKDSLNGKVMLEGFVAYKAFRNTEQDVYDTEQLGLTYCSGTGEAYPTTDRAMLYLYSPAESENLFKLSWNTSAENIGIRYAGYVGYERITQDSSIYYRISPELLKFIRKSVTISYINKGELIVFIGSYKITYDLYSIKNSIENAQISRDKTQEIQNMNQLLGLTEVDDTGYILLKDYNEINSYYKDKPLMILSHGLIGIKVNYGRFYVSELCTNKYLEFETKGILSIGTLKLSHGAEDTFIKILSSGSIGYSKLDCTEDFKLNSLQYSKIISNIVNKTFSDSATDLELSHDARKSDNSKDYIVHSLAHSSKLSRNFISRLNDNGYKMMYSSLFRGKADLINGVILTKEFIDDVTDRDGHHFHTIIGYSYLMAVTVAIISGEDDVVNNLDQLTKTEKLRGHLKNNKLIAVYKDFKQSIGEGV